MQAALKPRLWTRHEYDRMVEAGILGPQDKVELIFGEILAMSPQKSQHSTGISLLVEALRKIFQSGFVIRAQAPLAVNEDSEPEPDVAVVRGAIRDFRDLHPATAVMVVEVSDTTLSFDRNTKRRLYAGAVIPEYWIVNLQEAVLEVYREPRGGDYHSQLRLERAQSIAPLAAPHASLPVAALLP